MARIMLEVEAEYQGIVEAVSELLDTVRIRRQEATNQTSIDYAQVEKEVAQGGLPSSGPVIKRCSRRWISTRRR